MTEAEKTTRTYNGREDVSIEAEPFSAKQPQIRNTVTNARHHYLVLKGGKRVELQVGDFIIRGADGQIDSMPAALFHQLFEIDAQAAEDIADEKAAAEAEAQESTREERQAAVDAKAEAAADAADAAEETTTDEPPADKADDDEAAPETPVNAADAVDYSGAPTHGDDDQAGADDETSDDIFGGDDQPEDPPAAPAKKAKKTSKRKKKA